MKILLVLINVILAFVAAFAASKVFRGDGGEALSPGREERGRKERVVQTGSAVAAEIRNNSGDPVEILLKNDVFSLSRCPSLDSQKNSFTLLGVIITPSVCGAIISQSNASGGSSGNNGGARNARRAPGSRGGAAGEVSYIKYTAPQHYFRVGEKINEQYTLSAVTANSATLSGDGDSITLALQTPYQSAAAAGNQNSNRNSGGRGNRGRMRGFGPMMPGGWNPGMGGGFGPMMPVGPGGWNPGGNRGPGGWNPGTGGGNQGNQGRRGRTNNR